MIEHIYRKEGQETIPIENIMSLLKDKDSERFGALISYSKDVKIFDSMLGSSATILKAVLSHKKNLKESAISEEKGDDNYPIKLIIGPKLISDKYSREEIICNWYKRVEDSGAIILLIVG